MEIYVMHDDKQPGPFSPEDVRAQIESGKVSTVDYAWTAGFGDWKCVGSA